MSLPRLICTSVIRSAHQGQSHGGVYLVDLAEERAEQVIDWNDGSIDWRGRGEDRGLRGIAIHGDEVYIAASDQIFQYDRDFVVQAAYGNRYLKHCHEICRHERTLLISSTGFDSILEFDLEERRFTLGHTIRPILGARDGRPQVLLQYTRFDPNGPRGPQFGDQLHINNVHHADGHCFIAALRLPRLLRLEAVGFSMFRRIPKGTHNARPWGEAVLCNDTVRGQVALIDAGGEPAAAVPAYDPADLLNADLPEDHARQGFNRGLCPIDDDLIAVGSSPANVSLCSMRSRTRRTTVTLSHDLRNAIHGLEIWPFD